MSGRYYSRLAQRSRLTQRWTSLALTLWIVGVTHVAAVAAQSTPDSNCEQGLRALEAGERSRAALILTEAFDEGSISSAAVGTCMLTLGNLRYEVEDFSGAAEVYRSVIANVEETDPAVAAAANNGLGRVELSQGRYSSAADNFSAAEQLARRADDSVQLTRAQAYQAQIVALEGDVKRALERLETLIRETVADEQLAGELWYIKGSVQAQNGDLQGAGVALARARDIQRVSGDQVGQMQTLFTLATVALQYGAQAEARNILAEASNLALARSGFAALARVQYLTAKAYTTGFLAMTEQNQEAFVDSFFRDAMTRANNAEELAQASPDRAVEMHVAQVKGDIYFVTRDVVQARASYEHAATLYEGLRQRTGGLTGTVAADGEDIYVSLIRALLANGDYDEIFSVVERAKSRQLLDQIASVDRGLSDPALNQLLERERKAYSDVYKARLELAAAQEAGEDTTRWEAELRDREQAHRAARRALQAQTVGQPLSAYDVQDALPPATTLLSYYILDQHTVIAHVITNQHVYPFVLQVDRLQLNQAIGQLRAETEFSGGPPEGSEQRIPAALSRLHSMLVAPLLPALRSTHLIIAPHDELHYVPFAALADGQSALLNRFGVSTLPSASSLPLLRRNLGTATRQALVLGNPQGNLRAAQEEAQLIAELYGDEPLILDSASKLAFTELAPTARIIHIAAHADFRAQDPLASPIILAPSNPGNDDGNLTIGELYGMSLPATDLVVLSACRTSVGSIAAGSEFISLSNAFLTAGAPSIVATLWRVEDVSTSDLMRDFYGNLKNGHTKAEALRLAQLSARERNPNPYFWAGFVLIGENGSVASTLMGVPLTYTTAWGVLVVVTLLCFVMALAAGSGRRVLATIFSSTAVVLVFAFVAVLWVVPATSGSLATEGADSTPVVASSPMYLELPPLNLGASTRPTFGSDSLQVWDARSDQLVAEMPLEAAIDGLDFHPDGSLLAVSADTVSIWPTSGNAEPVQTEVYSELRNFTSDGQSLLMAQSSRVTVWDVSDRRIRFEVENPDYDVLIDFQSRYHGMIAFSLDQRSLLLSGFSMAAVIDGQTGTIKRELTYNFGRPVTPFAVGVGSTGKMVAIAEYDGTVHVWQADELIAAFSLPELPQSLTFTLDERLLIGTDLHGNVRIWDVSRREEMLSYAHRAEVSRLLQTPDGHYLFTASDDGIVQILDFQALQLIGDGLRHNNAVRDMDFVGAGGKRLVTGSDDGTARVWDLSDISQPREIIRIIHKGQVVRVAASSDGGVVATAATDGTVRLWKLSE